jgi:hypothetical protein
MTLNAPDFRHMARQSLARAKAELAANDSSRFRYAALELRDAMEALTYDRALAFQDDIPSVGQRHPPSGVLETAAGAGDSHTARNRSSWSGPGQKLMWWSRGLPSAADAGQTFPLAAPAAVPSASRWPAPVRPACSVPELSK